MGFGDWISKKAGDLSTGFGEFVGAQASNVGKGAKKGLGLDTPRSPDQAEEPGLLRSAFDSITGGAKKNWLELLIGGFFALTVGKKIGDFIPGGLSSTIATMVITGLVAAFLTNSIKSHFSDASSDTTPVKPDHKVQLTTTLNPAVEHGPAGMD